MAGFWLGLWHGIIAPVTFLISLFTDNVNIYEVHNNGNWYDFGFVLGAGILFGGGGAPAGDRQTGDPPGTRAGLPSLRVRTSDEYRLGSLGELDELGGADDPLDPVVEVVLGEMLHVC